MTDVGYYDDLGIDKSASHSDVKRAYRQLAKEFHPDRNASKNATDDFKRITSAYEVLSDVKQRKKYDNECDNQFDLNKIFNSNSFNNKFNKHKIKAKKKFEKEAKSTIKISFKEAILGVKDKKIINHYKKE